MTPRQQLERQRAWARCRSEFQKAPVEVWIRVKRGANTVIQIYGASVSHAVRTIDQERSGARFRLLSRYQDGREIRR